MLQEQPLQTYWWCEEAASACTDHAQVPLAAEDDSANLIDLHAQCTLLHRKVVLMVIETVLFATTYVLCDELSLTMYFTVSKFSLVVSC